MSSTIDCMTVGDSYVGKTFFSRACTNRPFEVVGATCCIDNWGIKFPDGREALIWDTAGQEKFEAMIRIYFMNKHLVFLVYDATSRSSFDHCQYWANKVEQLCNMAYIKVLVANKIDIKEYRCVTKKEVMTLAAELGYMYLEADSYTTEGRNNVSNEFVNLVNQTFDFISNMEAEEEDDGDHGHNDKDEIVDYQTINRLTSFKLHTQYDYQSPVIYNPNINNHNNNNNKNSRPRRNTMKVEPEKVILEEKKKEKKSCCGK
ncbi:hypothetical protein SAMD00019534_104770, partial [Acytostelium subglobosum LB1]|uniref:hypothetical protein n=1 Tax=Acytostelium subglobosum LB1 TaxID=1410327 RepID=UPI000644A52F